jgi:hypothetical protein
MLPAFATEQGWLLDLVPVTVLVAVLITEMSWLVGVVDATSITTVWVYEVWRLLI